MPRESRIEIQGDWHGRDRHLLALAKATGFLTIPRMLTHVANELGLIRGKNGPRKFYRALACFSEHASRKG